MALGAPDKTASKKRGDERGKGGMENKRRVKKLKYSFIPEEWGGEGLEESTTQFLYSGLEGVGHKIRAGGKQRNKEVRERAENVSEQKTITSWIQVLEKGVDPHYRKKIAIRTTGAQGNSFLTSCSMSQKTKFTYKYMFLLISKTCDIY